MVEELVSWWKAVLCSEEGTRRLSIPIELVY